MGCLTGNLVISDVLLDDEKVQTSNIVYQKVNRKVVELSMPNQPKIVKRPRKYVKTEPKREDGKSRKG